MGCNDTTILETSGNSQFSAKHKISSKITSFNVLIKTLKTKASSKIKTYNQITSKNSNKSNIK